MKGMDKNQRIVSFLKRRSIGFRLAVPVALFYVITSAIFLIFSYKVTSSIQERSFKKEALERKKELIRYIEALSRTSLSISYTVSLLPEVKDSLMLYRRLVKATGNKKDAETRARAYMEMRLESLTEKFRSTLPGYEKVILGFYLSSGKLLYSTEKKVPKIDLPHSAEPKHGILPENSHLFVYGTFPVFGDHEILLGYVASILPVTSTSTAREKESWISILVPTPSGLRTVFGNPELAKIAKRIIEPNPEKEGFGKKGTKRFFTFPLKNEKGKTLALCVYVADESKEMLEVRKSVLKVVALISLFFLVLSATLFYLKETVTSPINSMKSVVDELKLGNIRGKRLHVEMEDEIGKLAKSMNELLDHIEKLNLFKKVIEDDESLSDVYKRISNLMEKELGFNNYTLYEVNNSKNYMRIVGAKGEGFSCHEDILTNADLCRAKRTASSVREDIMDDICPRFIGKQNFKHICIPVRMGEAVGLVVQIVLEERCLASNREEVERKISTLKTYLEESSPVISSKRLLSALRESTTRDPLTGLFNRRFLHDYLETAVFACLRRGSHMGLLMMDIDHFKEVNDTYGHDSGDVVLKEIARTISVSVRKSDVLVRFGGEEFLLILNDVDEKHVVDVAEKLRRKVELQTIVLPDGTPLKKTISIGVSVFPDDSEDIWECIKFADIALYEAKNTGRNRVVRFEKRMLGEKEEHGKATKPSYQV